MHIQPYRLLEEICLALGKTQDPNNLMHEVVTQVKEEFSAQVCSLYLYQEDRDSLVLRATEGLFPEAVGKVSLAAGDGLVGMVFQKQQIFTIDKAQTHEKFHYFPSIGEERFQGFMGAPLLAGGKTIGVLVLQHEEARKYSQEETSAFMAIASSLAGILQAAALEREKLRIVETQRQMLEKEVHARSFEMQELNRMLEKQVQTEVRRRKEKEELLHQQSGMVAMGEMLSMIAHQWRQPLAAIAAEAASMQVGLDLGLTESLPRSIEEVRTQTRYLTQTIQDFRRFLHPDKEKHETRLSEVLQNSLRIMGKTLELNGIFVETQISSTEPLKTFPNELIQVLLILFANAKEAYNGQERVNKRVKVRIGKEGEKHLLELADEAGGIPPEVLPKVFEQYFTTKGEKGGSGLGLYMSRLIVEKHCQGEISVSNQGRGACFKILLPPEVVG